MTQGGSTTYGVLILLHYSGVLYYYYSDVAFIHHHTSVQHTTARARRPFITKGHTCMPGDDTRYRRYAIPNTDTHDTQGSTMDYDR